MAAGPVRSAIDTTRNEVVLCGRVAAPAEERELPSGDSLVTARVIVDRDQTALSRSNQRVDTIDCVAWLARAQRTMRCWQAGDNVRVEGSIRRRFFRGQTGSVSRVQVEVKRAKRLRPAPAPSTGAAQPPARRDRPG